MNKFNCIRFAYQRKTLTEQTKKHNKQIERMIICVVLKIFSPESFSLSLAKAGLLTCFLQKSLPVERICDSGEEFLQMAETYSYGDSSGFAPDSLLSLREAPFAVAKVQRFCFFNTHRNLRCANTSRCKYLRKIFAPAIKRLLYTTPINLRIDYSIAVYPCCQIIKTEPANRIF